MKSVAKAHARVKVPASALINRLFQSGAKKEVLTSAAL